MGDSDNEKSEADRKTSTLYALKRIEIYNSDIELTEHAAKMMFRRDINSNALADAIYSNRNNLEVENSGEIIYKSVSRKDCIEVVCIPEQCGESDYYKIRVITVHKLPAEL
jgi:hypothetical protein